MKIIKLQCQNFKRLVAVEIKPDGNVVLITGKNGAGKSSCLDAIMGALCGKKYCPEKPVREGQKKAKIVVDMGEYIVTRTLMEGGGGMVKVETPQGMTISSPQAFLDKIVGKITFDPLDFINESDPKKQRKALLELVGLDMTATDETIKNLREQRTAVGRTLKQAQAEAHATETYPDAPKEQIGVDEINKQLSEAHVLNAKRLYAEHKLKRAYDEIETARQKMDALAKQCAVIETFLAENQVIEESELQDRVAKINETNRRVRTNAEVQKKTAYAMEVGLKYDRLSSEIEEEESKKVALLANAEMPMDGLSITEEGVTFNGIPIAQIADSEKLRVGIAVSMKMNPELRVLRITDGSLLDSDNMALISKIVQDNDFQLWIERVNDQSGVGFVIEDGMVKG